MKSPRSVESVSAGLLVLVASTLWAAAPSDEKGTTASISGDATMVAQVPLVAAADSLNSLLRSLRPSPMLPDSEYPNGFASIEIDVPTGTTTLYWKTGISRPAEVDALVAQLNGKSGAAVVVRAAAMQRSEIVNEMRRLAEESIKSTDLRLTEISPLPHGDGIHVEVDQQFGSRSVTHPILNAAKVRLTQFTGARIELALGNTRKSLTRENDTPPYWGGNRLAFPNGVGCSSGFAIQQFASYALLTAGHCSSRSNQVAVWTERGMQLGNPPIGSTQNAVQANNGIVWTDSVRVYVSSSAGRIYDGQLGQNYSKAVKGWGDSYVGLWLCTSGAYSGVRCDIRVSAVDVLYSDEAGIIYQNSVLAQHVYGQSAAGEGDSGGPVFSLVNNNADAWAYGIISAGDTANAPAPCVGQIYPPRKCSSKLFYSTIRSQLGVQGLYWFLVTQ